MRYPDHALVLITLPNFSGIARHVPHVDSILEFDAGRLIASLQTSAARLHSAMQIVMDFLGDSRLGIVDMVHNMSHTPQAAMFCRLLNAPLAYGLYAHSSVRQRCRGRWYQYLLSTIQERANNPFNIVDIFSRCSGVYQTSQSDPGLKYDDCDKLVIEEKLGRLWGRMPRRLVVFIPGASAANRQWPPDFFAKLGNILFNNQSDCVSIGSTSEQALGKEIEIKSAGRVKSLCGETGIGELLALLDKATLVIGNDTGPLHMAAALGTQTLGLYIGPADAKDTAPYGRGHVVLQRGDGWIPCDYRKRCDNCTCKTFVGPDFVAAVAQHILSGSTETLPTLAGIKTFVTDVAESGELALMRIGTALEQNGEQERAFWSYMLDGENPVARSYHERHSHYEHSIMKQKLIELIDRFLKKPLQVLTTDYHSALCERNEGNDLGASLARYLTVRVNLAPREHVPLLTFVEETIQIIIRAAHWLSESSCVPTHATASAEPLCHDC